MLTGPGYKEFSMFHMFRFTGVHERKVVNAVLSAAGVGRREIRAEVGSATAEARACAAAQGQDCHSSQASRAAAESCRCADAQVWSGQLQTLTAVLKQKRKQK